MSCYALCKCIVNVLDLCRCTEVGEEEVPARILLLRERPDRVGPRQQAVRPDVWNLAGDDRLRGPGGEAAGGRSVTLRWQPIVHVHKYL